MVDFNEHVDAHKAASMGGAVQVVPRVRDIEQRQGTFRLTRKQLRDLPIRHIREVFSHFVIYRAESQYEYDAVLYHAFSPLFDECGEWDTVPRYTVTITEDLEGAVAVTVTK
jgi:hypothetical protein